MPLQSLSSSCDSSKKAYSSFVWSESPNIVGEWWMVLKPIVCWLWELWIYLLLIQCEIQAATQGLFISQVLAFDVHDICSFFCYVLVVIPLPSHITDQMSAQKPINKSLLHALSDSNTTQVELKQNKPSIWPKTVFSFLIPKPEAGWSFCFHNHFCIWILLLREISGKIIRSDQSMWAKMDARVNVSLSHTEIYKESIFL